MICCAFKALAGFVAAGAVGAGSERMVLFWLMWLRGDCDLSGSWLFLRRIGEVGWEPRTWVAESSRA